MENVERDSGMTDARVKTLIREMDKIVRRDDGEPVWLDPVDAAHIAACLRGEAAQPACPNDDKGATQLHRHNVFVYEVDFGDEGKGQYVRLADFNRVAELVPDAAPAPVAGDAVRRLPPLPQAFFDEFGIGADDRVQDYARAALAQDRASQGAKRVPTGPRFTNTGDSEAQFIADGERLDCPACGGSGHAEDASQGAADTPKRYDAPHLFAVERLPPRDEAGRLSHPDLSIVLFTEDEWDVGPFFAAAGHELKSVRYDWTEDDDNDGYDMNWLTPEAPEGEGWLLVSIDDNEDGEGVVWWSRFVGRSETLPSQGAAAGVPEADLIDAAMSVLNDNNGKIGKRKFRADATAVVRRVLRMLAAAPQPAHPDA